MISQHINTRLTSCKIYFLANYHFQPSRIYKFILYKIILHVDYVILPCLAVSFLYVSNKDAL